MAHRQQQTNEQPTVKVVSPSTPEMELLLQGGYPDMSVKRANAIIKERQANPQSWPYEQQERAEAFLAAYNTPSKAVSKLPGWKRDRG